MSQARGRQQRSASPLETLFADGVALHQAGKLQEAEHKYNEVLRVDSRHFGALHLLGVVGIQTGQFDWAVRLIEMAIGVNGMVADAHCNLGSALLALKRPHEALKSFEKAIALNRQLGMAHNNRGKALLDLKRPEEALASFDKAIAINPKVPLSYSNRGKALLDLNRLKEALESVDRALALQREFPEAWNNRAHAMNLLCQWEESEKACRMALTLRPDYVDAWTNLAWALNELNRCDEAVSACHTALKLQPDDIHAWCPLGYALVALRRWTEAEEASRKAVAGDPEDTRAWTNLSIALSGQNRPREAADAMRRACALAPDRRVRAPISQSNLRELAEFITRLVAAARAQGGSFELHEAQVRELHRIIMSNVLLDAGEYRKRYVVIGGWKILPPFWGDVPGLVEEMCQYVNSNWAREATHLGAFISWHLIWTHPFNDGNGRTARALCYLVMAIKGAPLPDMETFVERVTESETLYLEYIDSMNRAHEAHIDAGDVNGATAHLERWLLALLSENREQHLIR